MLLLDLFCGAGGASTGYSNIGFEVVGIDNRPQPHYPFPFYQGDALDPSNWLEATNGREPDVIHASPPCQAYSVANNIHGRLDHPDLVPKTRELLQAWGGPYIIENVIRAPLINPALVCGLSLGLNVRRHRIFESNVPLESTVCIKGHPGDWLLVFGHTVLERGHTSGLTAKGGPIIRRKHVGVARGKEAMGIDWMNIRELSEAIPPPYTEFIGKQVMESINGK